MIEITSTKLNPNTIPHLHVFGWEIPVYFFLGGISAGLLVISAIKIMTSEHAVNNRSVKWASLLAPVLLNIGMICLLLDLSHKINVWRFYTRFVPTSPMSWGSWALIIFMPFSALQAMILFKDAIGSLPLVPTIIQLTEKHLKKIAAINVFMGTFIGIYTGILFSSLFARPLWASPILGVLFLFSGLSAGAALMLIIAEKEDKHVFSKIDMQLIMVEAVIICLFIIGALMGTASGRDAMMFLISGPYAIWFWVVTILGGILIPIVFEALEVAGKFKYSVFVPLLVLVGSLSLRFVLVYAGQAVPTIS
ncbi:MAG: polysulfide reductase NrfD [Proteobacteria bacterium]|nr:polysulfide reductase NrfD [Pseudomonadota bacterium]